MHPMVKRQRAAQACIDRFVGKPYTPGVRDCARLAAHSMHGMGRKVGLLKGVKYTSEVGAVKALRKLGFADLIAAVDALGLERIPPAAALPGDLVAMPCAPGPFGCALMVAVGNGRVLGFSDGVCAVFQPLEFVTAWRV